MNVSDRVPVMPGRLVGNRRWALTGWRCLICGEMWEAADIPYRCCPAMFAIRVDIIRKAPHG